MTTPRAKPPSRRTAAAKRSPATSARTRQARAAPRAGERTAAKTRPDSPAGRERLDVAILRFIRRTPNRAVDLGPVAAELDVDPYELQVEVERLHQRGMLIAPFIEPGTAGGAELTQKGLRWLIEQEGGKPSEVPVLLQPASDRVRAEDEAARLPRAKVYGIRTS